MALVESIDIPLGSPLNSFQLSDPSGALFNSASLMGPKGLLIVFTCNHCPYALAIWPRLIRLAHKAQELGIQTVAINPNIHPNYPEDAPPIMAQKIKEWKIGFPYLIDATQKVAQAYKAQCTPDLYLFDANQKLAYHGRLDDNWKDETKVTREELWEAILALSQNKAPQSKQLPSMGCSIKWK